MGYNNYGPTGRSGSAVAETAPKNFEPHGVLALFYIYYGYIPMVGAVEHI
jgi:hypothetical protein